jgi:hypothetical protein
MGGCTLWEGAVAPSGYGKFPTTRFGTRVAHRVAWIRANGPIPSGMLVCHTCDTPLCVNLEHLFLGTPADNMRDKMLKGRCSRTATTRPGGGHPRATLSDAEALQMREHYAGGANRQAISLLYDVPLDVVKKIIYRRSYTHI